MDAAAAGDELLVTAGVYAVSAPVTVTNAIHIRGVGGREAVVVDAEYRCGVFFVTNEGARLEGLTLTRGGAEEGGGVYAAHPVTLSNCAITACTNRGLCMPQGGTIQNCLISDNYSDWNGGGLDGEQVEATDSQFLRNRCRNQGGGAYAYLSVFSNCVFEGNLAKADGGGLLVGGRVSQCRISDNHAHGGQGGGGAYLAGVQMDGCYVSGNTCTNGNADGGGLLIFNSTVSGCEVVGNFTRWGGGGIGCSQGCVISNCVLRNNQADGYGGGVWMYYGGALYNSVVRDNGANAHGGGINMHYGGYAADCLVTGNKAAQGGGIQCYYTGRVERCLIEHNLGDNSGIGGGGIHFYYGGSASNSLIVHNRTEGQGGGAYFRSGGRLEHCTVSANAADAGAGGVYSAYSVGTLQNTIVYHNASEYSGTMYFTNCCTTPLPGGPGNLDADPLFLHREADDYRLATNSPCVNAGTNMDGVASATDLDGAPRRVGPAVDIGAYEQGTLVCAFSAAPERGVAPLDVQFNGWAGGTNPAGLYYSWDYENDGTPDAGGLGVTSVTHSFTLPGVYTVSLAVSNAGEQAVRIRTDVVTVLGGTTCYVAAAGANIYPYDTWSNAAWHIQDAINACLPGGLVWVTNGNYHSFICLLITNDIRVMSVNGPAVTFVDGCDSRRGFYLDHPKALAAGFTITNAYPNYLGQLGAGAYIVNAGVVSNCVIRDCRAGSGGGFACENGGLFVDCEVLNNKAMHWGGGGYMVNSGEVRNCIIRGNSASNYDGGGVYIDNAGAVRSCIIESNRAPAANNGYGGGVYCGGNGALIENCWIRGNTGGALGGGVFVSSSARVPIRHCAILGNSVQRWGGGVYGGLLQHCTVLGNTSGQSGGGTQNSTNWNSIVYYNTVAGLPQNTASGTCQYTCTTPDPGGPGNLTAEPGVISLTNPMITSNSPCVDAGNNALAWGATDLFGYPRTNGPAVDMGCHEFTASTLTGALSVAISGEFSNAVRGFELDFEGALGGNLGGYVWDFGDGVSASNALFVTHAYDASAHYPLVLTVWNNDGAASATVQVHIVDGYTNYASLVGAPLAPYTNWAQAARTIQDAIDANTYAGSDVVAADGEYTQGGAMAQGLSNRVVLTKPLTVSALNPRQAVVVGGDENVRCAYLNERGRLMGLAFRQGVAAATGAWPYAQSGGGILFDGGGLVSNGLITACAAVDGGGAHCYLGGELRNCELVGNRATNTGGGARCTRGGVVEQCLLAANAASNTSGSAYGGGLYCTNGGSVTFCAISNNFARSGGGGLYANWGGSVTLSDCRIVGNVTLGNGGGVYHETTGWVTRCEIIGNRATNSSGGGVYGYGPAVVSNCILQGNEARSGGGVCLNDRGRVYVSTIHSNTGLLNGGGAYLYNYCTVEDCVVSDNRATEGGGLYLGGTYATGRLCRIEGNVAGTKGGGISHASGACVLSCIVRSNTAGYGGGIYSWYGWVQNCLVAGNTATNAGGGQWARGVRVLSCTVAGNTAGVSGGGLFVTNTCALTNVIAVGNLAPDGSNVTAVGTGHTFAYCCIAPLMAGVSNLDSDPLFVAAEDYRLATNSPCVDTGTNQWWMAADTDLEGKPRLLNDTVDRGAYELIPSAWDTDGDLMPDCWEWEYSQSMTAMVASVDDDGDFYANLPEYYAGTIPTDDLSYLGLVRVQRATTTTGLVVHWQSAADRSYRVEACSQLVTGAWVLIQGSIPATPPVNVITDVTAAAQSAGHYRVQLE
ncbi:MAG TPA: choice-of-anchor Q domain-containing protein [Kiritimatiellia bacterium]|nr:choice-of-anchor Q domain-containing protein [Kiritimatiellia bacterium]HSA19773.1 choice-of-anchor Q domain-containing protein [Kiritimatiellia bacterium]